MLYPSKVGYGDKINVLTPLSEILHANNIKLIVMWYANRPPFSTKNWQFPLEESSRFADKEPFDNILYGSWFKEKWTQLMLEALELGADGVCVLPDEYYYRGPRLPITADNVTDQSMVRAFKQRYGYDAPPAREEDSRRFRAWKLLQYQGLADLTAHFCKAVHEKFPAAYCTTNITITPYSHNAGMEHGVAYDLIGHSASLDGFGTDPYFSAYAEGHWMIPGVIKSLRGAQSPDGRRGAVLVLQANQWWPKDPIMASFFRPVWSYGAVASAVAHGGTGVAFYRYNYLTDGPGYARNTANVFRLLNSLEARGLAQTSTPRNVAFLTSRTSVDWYQLKVRHEGGGASHSKSTDKLYVEELTGGAVAADAADVERARLCESIRGQVYEKAVMEQLLAGGHSFEQFYLDCSADLAALQKDYRLAVVPFAYSIPRESVAQLEKAVQRGLKLLLIRQLGETDPLGEAYTDGPALAGLVARYPDRVFHWNDDLVAGAGERQWAERFQNLVQEAVGGEAPVRIINDGDVEVAVRRDAQDRLFIFLINWDGRPRTVQLRMTARDAQVEQFRCVDGAPFQLTEPRAVPAEKLGFFSVSLHPGEVRVIHVRK